MIVPISLESDIEVVREQVVKARVVGATRFHVDIIDGLYADNVTVAPADLQALDFSGLELDLHLLVDDPVEWLPECVALSPKRIYAQIEKMGNIEYFVKTLREHEGVKVGLGLGLHTPLSALDSMILDQIDGVVLMAIEAGFGGTPFHPEVLARIRALRGRYQGEIFVDGGITPATYQQVLEAGATEAGANSAYWRGEFDRG